MDVAIATCRVLPEPDPDQELLSETFARAGIEARMLAWDDPSARFEDARVTVIRSTWNYLHRVDDFVAWAERVGPRLANPPAIVRWNSHKGYLLDLASRGIAIVPTVIVPRGTERRLADVLALEGWDDAVVKPAVSAGSFGTLRVSRASPSEERFAELVRERDMMVQPYVKSVEAYGERSLIMVGGEITHAIRKSPRFAGHHESVTSVPFTEEEHAFASRVLALAKERGPLTYGRVDMARDDRGTPMLMELEVIEPSLFLRQHPPAAAKLVDAVRARLTAT